MERPIKPFCILLFSARKQSPIFFFSPGPRARKTFLHLFLSLVSIFVRHFPSLWQSFYFPSRHAVSSFFFIYERIPAVLLHGLPCSPKHRANYFLSGFSDLLAPLVLHAVLLLTPFPTLNPLSPSLFSSVVRKLPTAIRIHIDHY